MSDDHASHAIGCYGSRINVTPRLDQLAAEGLRFDSCFCTNSICTPSRASILTGTYAHVNGTKTLTTMLDARIPTFPGLLQESGYQTAVFGKWHLGHGPLHDPRGFDDWVILPGQGDYHDPEMLSSEGSRSFQGYVTDVVTDLALNWLEKRDRSKPYCLLVHHKAPHRPWVPDDKHAHMYEHEQIPEPASLRDDYAGRSEAAMSATIRVGRDLDERDWKEPVPDGLSEAEELSWKYQRYMKDYLRCVASIDDNVGRLVDYLEVDGTADNTVVIYTSDQGFFLGDHGWSNKRFMYEESLRMPLLIRYPELVEPGTRNGAMVLNVDFAQSLLDLAGVKELPTMQGRSIVPLLRGERPQDWRTSMYYRYWMHDDELTHVRGHYGVRTERYKLVYYCGEGYNVPGASSRKFDPEWELFDLALDPAEMRSVYGELDYKVIQQELQGELQRLRAEVGDGVL